MQARSHKKQLDDERRDWIEAIMEQLMSEKRRLICLAAVDRWYQGELKKEGS